MLLFFLHEKIGFRRCLRPRGMELLRTLLEASISKRSRGQQCRIAATPRYASVRGGYLEASMDALRYPGASSARAALDEQSTERPVEWDSMPAMLRRPV